MSWFSNLLPSIEAVPGQIAQTAQNVGQSFQVPIQQLGHAALPKIIPDVTPQQQQQAMQGSEFAMAPYSLADPANSVVGSTLDTAATAAKPVVKAAVDETKANVNANGGAQAGFIGMGKKASNELPPIVSKVTAKDAAKSVFGSEHTADIQDALQRNGVQDYNGIAPAAHNLYDNIIKPELFNNPKPVKIDDVVNSIVGEMRKAKPGIDPTAAVRAAKSVIIDMYDRARAATGNAEPVPTHIDTPSLFGIKQDLNSTDAVKNYFAGNPPQDITDSATVAARNALGKIIQGAHPEVAQATKDYGLLQDAVPSIYKATNQAAKDAASKPPPDPMSLIGGKSLDYLPGGPLLHTAGNKVLNSPTGRKILGGAGLVGAGVGGEYLLNNRNPAINNHINNSNPNQNGVELNNPANHNSTIISQPYSNIKPDSSGHFDLSQNAPTGSRTYMSENDYQSALSKLTQQYPAGGDVYNANKTLLDSQYANDQAQAQNVFKGNNIQNFMDNATNYNDDGNSLYDTFNSTALGQGFWNGVAQAKSIGAYTSPQYTQELQQISAFDKEFSSAYQSVTGETPDASQLLSAANSPSEAGKKWASMMQFINGTYSKYQAPYLALTSSSGAQTNQGTGQTAAGVQNGTYSVPPSAPSSGQTNIGVGPSIIPLPPIQ